ncbi:hypothetical protein BW723_08680 [Polaribacter reichenbachii]|uniref:Lipoprotein n=1 Tax=Polaribacter reichenbachii TaxID=996801 RepID=A0A1B8U778_9FLAO|nr:DUF6146 family protein [Polaribacter reichenbachii]APZ46368.1 hypothetical protein BW723_08680 [Polaribacter reichenbachii]AUC20232.1 hypothetical protein BTO17_16710 [Polaribacter reichenbachii]OBY67678.1 hypothetical protein LPB301_00825 [Polaribacter reichenbachii]
MKTLKQILVLFAVSVFFWACGSSPINKTPVQKEEPVVIANDSLEYEITIIDIGFNNFLNSIAKPEGFYSQQYLEARNRAWVVTWNQRARTPNQFNASIYENIIDYQPTVDYGYEVNYKLFNYFLFAQRKYKMNLGGGFRTNRIN